ncbi:hypothetical protein TSAR_015438 [Trichomalopsis sarcophagae]|uniref:Uncharacterized protein n=1 Tax=Trichomalopsis sarcophagae TaxID=543379 RepID=A0A232EHR5_9HYME|nr:hypothetical protein TSAR_015438 [Trichomalopsis sarcophagae]
MRCLFSSLYLIFRQPVGMFGSKGTTKTNVLSALVIQAIIKIEKAGVNGGSVKWAFYEAPYYRDIQSNLRVCPKLTENHIKLVHAIKIRVSLATQIFSNSTLREAITWLDMWEREKDSDDDFLTA